MCSSFAFATDVKCISPLREPFSRKQLKPQKFSAIIRQIAWFSTETDHLHTSLGVIPFLSKTSDSSGNSTIFKPRHNSMLPPRSSWAFQSHGVSILFEIIGSVLFGFMLPYLTFTYRNISSGYNPICSFFRKQYTVILSQAYKVTKRILHFLQAFSSNSFKRKSNLTSSFPGLEFALFFSCPL